MAHAFTSVGMGSFLLYHSGIYNEGFTYFDTIMMVFLFSIPFWDSMPCHDLHSHGNAFQYQYG